MLTVGTTGKLSGVPCRVTPHLKNGTGKAITLQLLEFDSFTGWNWAATSAPSTTMQYNLNVAKYYHWYDLQSTDFIPDVEPMAETVRSGSLSQPKQGYNCVQCNDENKLAEPNMTNGRFMCFGCRSTDWWRYEGQFL